MTEPYGCACFTLDTTRIGQFCVLCGFHRRQHPDAAQFVFGTEGGQA